MYEKSNTGFNKALQSACKTLKTQDRRTDNTAETSEPGELIASIFSRSAISDIMSLLHEDDEESTPGPINTFINDYNICFEPLSELASTGPAFCSLFWDSGGDWVVAACKSVVIVILYLFLMFIMGECVRS
jgi:hypothetical protein